MFGSSVRPVTGVIHSLGNTSLHKEGTTYSTISIRLPDGRMQVERQKFAMDVVDPEVAAGRRGTFYFWKHILVAVRHPDGTITESIERSIRSYLLFFYFAFLVFSIFLIGIPMLLLLILFGPRASRIRENVMAHAAAMDVEAAAAA